MEFYHQWEVPDANLVKAYIDTNFPDEYKRADMQQALEFAAMYSHTIMGEDAEDAQIKGIKPEILELLKQIELTGNPIDRGLKMWKVAQDAREYENVLKAHGKELTKAYIDKKAKAEEKKTANGRGGDSHGGDWFGGMEFDSPIRTSPSEKRQIMDAIKQLKKHTSFNLQAKKSKKVIQDDWGEIELMQMGGLPPDPSMIVPEDLAFDELFDYKFMMSQIYYWENYAPKVLPKEWVLLIDDSGSMNNPRKLQWVLAMLSILAEDVIKNGSVAYIGMYEEYLSPFAKLDSAATVKDFMSKFRGGHGGDTDIAGALRTVAGMLKTGGLDHFEVKSDLEIFLVCDGQDAVPGGFTPPAKSHCLSLYNKNLNLDLAVKRSGGTAFHVDHTGLSVSNYKTNVSELEDYEEEVAYAADYED